MKAQFDTNEHYHSAPGISASGLKSIYKKSVYHFINQKPFESSAMALGTAVHCAMLEPEMYYKEFHVMPKIDRRTKAGKEQFAIEQKKRKAKNWWRLMTTKKSQKYWTILEITIWLNNIVKAKSNCRITHNTRVWTFAFGRIV